jgi:hypothetical protein
MNFPPAIYKERFFWLGLVSGGFFLSLTLWYGFGADHATYSYAAWVWKVYQLPPYVGAFTGYFPGIFFVHRLVLELFGGSLLAFRVFDFLVQLSVLGMIYYLTRRLSGSGVAGFLACILFGIYYYGLGIWLTGQRDGYGLFLLLLCTIVSLALEQRPWLRSVVAGVLMGFAFLLKPTFGLGWVLFGLWYLAEGWHRRKAVVVLELLVFGFGCLLPSALVVLYYWHGGFIEYLKQGPLWYPFAVYSKVYHKTILVRMAALPFMAWTMIHEGPITISGTGLGLLALTLNWRELKQRKLFGAISGLLLVGLLSWIIQGWNIGYHRIPAWGFLFILAGTGWAWLGERIRQTGSGLKSRMAAGFLYLGILGMALASLDWEWVRFAGKYSFRSLREAYMGDSTHSPDQLAAAEYLKPLLRPEDEIEFFGRYPLLPFVLKKKIPSRFPIPILILLRPYDGKALPRLEQWRKQYSQDVIRTAPRFFLLSTDVDEQNVYNVPETSLSEALAKEFPELQKFLAQNYQLVKTIGTIDIYELNPVQRRL